MRLTRLKIKDFSRHKLIDENIDVPVVGLVGPNGYGKTAILAAIKFAFTGVLADKQETYVRDYFEKYDGQPSNGSVQVWFRKDGKEGELFRQVGASPKRHFKWDGETYTRAADIENVLQELFEADKGARANAIFPPQGTLDKMLFGTLSERSEMFTKLLLVGYMSKVEEQINKQVSILINQVQDYTSLLTEVKTQHELAEDELAKLEGELSRSYDWGKEQQAFSTYLSAVDSFVNIRTSVKENAEAIRQNTLSFDKSVEEIGLVLGLKPHEATYELISDKIQELLDQERDLQNGLALEQSKQRAKLRHEDKLKQLQAIEDTIRTKETELSNVTPGPDISTVTGLEHRQRDLEIDLRTMKEEIQMLEQLEQTGENCPTCGSKCGEDYFEKRIFQLKEAFADKENKCHGVKMMAEAYREKFEAAEKELACYHQDIGKLKGSLDYVQEELKKVDPEEERKIMSYKDDGLNMILNQIAEIGERLGKIGPCKGAMRLKELRNQEKAVQGFRASLAANKAQQKQEQDRVEELRAGFSERVLELLRKNEERDVATILSARADEYNTLRGQVNQAAKYADDLMVRKHQIEEMIERDQRRQAMVTELKVLKQSFSRKGIPQAYMQYVFSSLTPMAQNNLTTLGANFVIRPSEKEPVTVDFMKLTGDRSGWMPQNKLSGGQKVRVSIAYLLAVQQLIIPDIAFLALDEPSSHIDDEGIDSMKELFEAMGKQLKDTEAQAIICDHKPELQTAFQKTIVVK